MTEITRRQVIATTAIAAGVAVCPFTGASAAPNTTVTQTHGEGALRGSDIAVTSGPQAEARFGLMFKNLSPFRPSDSMLLDLSKKLVDPRLPDANSSVKDQFDNPDVPAGFTFLGQFIDHDMTRDTTSMPEQDRDSSGLMNFDSPFFDLKSMYGRGPKLDPQLYESDGKRLKIVINSHGVYDLPRNSDDSAIIGDPRNDENIIVMQLHMAFMRLHNEAISRGYTFTAARQYTRWTFQYIIVNDYLPHIVGKSLVDSLLHKAKTKIMFTGTLYKPKNRLKPMMPLEYSVAAFRFGHSMIRPSYELSDNGGKSIEKTLFDVEKGNDLRGSRQIKFDDLIDWNYFFEIPGRHDPDDRNMSRKMDTNLSLPLFRLPSTVVDQSDPRLVSLGARNLLRGKRLGLPCGQDVARAMGEHVLSNSELNLDSEWQGKAPLWYYILKEAELGGGGRKLGKVGGRIVAETILGIIAADPNSYFNKSPNYSPGSNFRMGSLLRRAGAV